MELTFIVYIGLDCGTKKVDDPRINLGDVMITAWWLFKGQWRWKGGVSIKSSHQESVITGNSNLSLEVEVNQYNNLQLTHSC